MELDAIKTSYARWAPVYDHTFGAVTNIGRKQAVRYINGRRGTVLEVGIGTGLSLRHYAPHLSVTGIDFSEAMLKKARTRVAELGLRHVSALRQMDARAMDFPDDHFDTVAAMHVLSVVPEPERVMSEIARVCRPGGKVVIANHFKSERGLMAFLARAAAPFHDQLGWHSDFSIETVLQEEALSLDSRRKVPPLGMMTFLVLVKTD